jgi:chorismate synthase
VPTGLGEPCFDKLEAMLAHAMLSIPATKGFEIGSGFAGTRMRGSKHNDPFVVKTGADGKKRLGTTTNHSGGIQGGITNGEHLIFKVLPCCVCRVCVSCRVCRVLMECVECVGGVQAAGHD